MRTHKIGPLDRGSIASIYWLALPFLYALGAWLALAVGPSESKTFLLVYTLVSSILLWPGYLYLRRCKAPPMPALWGAWIAFAATVLTPSLLQTDQLRYVWDGMMLGRGDNPFALSPSEALAREQTFEPPGVVRSPAGLEVPNTWAKLINHPELPTVYPPLAQVFFAFSSWLNPFFSLRPVNALFDDWISTFATLNWWPWELGWRLVLGAALGALVVIQRHHRWDLVLFHPLVFLTGFANVHVDGLMLPFLALSLAPLGRPSVPHKDTKQLRFSQMLPPGLLLGLSMLIRWTPLVLLPAFWNTWRRRGGWSHAALALAGTASTVAAGLALFLPGSQGRLFASSATYAEHWYFFGFGHRILADLLGALGFSGNAIQTSKLVLLATWLVLAGWVAWYAQQKRWSVLLTTQVLLVSFLIVLPTLHPWYFLPLLVLGHRHMKILVTPWLWPMLAALSYTFYFENKDPLTIRMVVYSVVTLALVRDARVIFRKRRRPLTTPPCAPVQHAPQSLDHA